MVHKDHRAFKDRRVTQALLEPPEQQGLLDLKGFKGQRATRGLLDLKGLRVVLSGVPRWLMGL
ncbi:MAG: hypothetical protein NTU41_09790 [Chloroflexi bacterium]|nr:hypothetical protein [Chloroflexota bacterium]